MKEKRKFSLGRSFRAGGGGTRLLRSLGKREKRGRREECSWRRGRDEVQTKKGEHERAKHEEGRAGTERAQVPPDPHSVQTALP